MVDRSGQADPRTKTKGNRKLKHPYISFEGSEQWRLIDKAIEELVENGDIEERTNRAYIVGYLCKTLAVKKIR